MPDGTLYAIIRNQGRFSTKFQLADYPFDTQFLTVAMEDTIASEDTQVYAPDTYPTNFGDLAVPQGGKRVVLSVPVASRPSFPSG